LHDQLHERAILIGEYIVLSGATTRETGRHFGVSKNTVFRDVRNRLPNIDPELARQAQAILEEHKSVRHLRGGEATKKRYERESGRVHPADSQINRNSQ
jgi:putative DeoR family transcriptional regulator (stage III sporulation protein D)